LCRLGTRWNELPILWYHLDINKYYVTCWRTLIRVVTINL
jgi:hypothetical protein